MTVEKADDKLDDVKIWELLSYYLGDKPYGKASYQFLRATGTDVHDRKEIARCLRVYLIVTKSVVWHIKWLLKHKGMSSRKFSRKVGMSEPQISKYTSGQLSIGNMSLHNAEKLNHMYCMQISKQLSKSGASTRAKQVSAAQENTHQLTKHQQAVFSNINSIKTTSNVFSTLKANAKIKQKAEKEARHKPSRQKRIIPDTLKPNISSNICKHTEKN